MMTRTFAVFSASVLFIASAAYGATRTWNGRTTPDLWSNPANWAEGIVPQAGDRIVFPPATQGATFGTGTNDLPEGTVFSSIVFNRSDTIVKGNGFAVTNGITVGPQSYPYYSPHVQVPVTVVGAQTWTSEPQDPEIDGRFDDVALNDTLRLSTARGFAMYVRGSGRIVSTSGESWIAFGGSYFTFNGSIDVQGGTVDVTNGIGESVAIHAAGSCNTAGDCDGGLGLLASSVGPIDISSGFLKLMSRDPSSCGRLSLSPGAAFQVTIQNRLNVLISSSAGSDGTVNLGGARLALTALPRSSDSYPDPRFPSGFGVFKIIDNDGTDPVAGTFAGLPEGAEFASGNGQFFRISYVGGDGNDVTLTALRKRKVRGDLDGDGYADLLWRHAVSGENYLWSMSSPWPSVRSAVSINTVPDLHWKIAGLGDFNGDGRTDILWHNDLTGEVYMYLMNETTIVSAGSVNVVSDLDWQVAGVADFNGDGKDDILWRHGQTGENYMYFMDGMSIALAWYLPQVDTVWKIAGVGDVTHAGIADIVWRNESNGQLYDWAMRELKVVNAGFLDAGISGIDWTVAGIADFGRQRHGGHFSAQSSNRRKPRLIGKGICEHHQHGQRLRLEGRRRGRFRQHRASRHRMAE
ncbi:MAG: hypothetical protein QOK37_1638 [Thermoanaerobaculia bacterium]|nr:hypothetical protein [Thermoanaerobaculia bacterium]